MLYGTSLAIAHSPGVLRPSGCMSPIAALEPGTSGVGPDVFPRGLVTGRTYWWMPLSMLVWGRRIGGPIQHIVSSGTLGTIFSLKR